MSPSTTWISIRIRVNALVQYDSRSHCRTQEARRFLGGSGRSVRLVLVYHAAYSVSRCHTRTFIAAATIFPHESPLPKYFIPASDSERKLMRAIGGSHEAQCRSKKSLKVTPRRSPRCKCAALQLLVCSCFIRPKLSSQCCPRWRLCGRSPLVHGCKVADIQEVLIHPAQIARNIPTRDLRP